MADGNNKGNNDETVVPGSAKQKRWHPERIRRFLNILQEFPALWNVTDQNYSNRIINLEQRREVARRMTSPSKIKHKISIIYSYIAVKCS